MPLKPVKIIKKGLWSVEQNDLMHLGMKNGDFFSMVWVRKVWVSPGLRHRSDAAMEEANVTCSYVTIGDHWALAWHAWEYSSHVCHRKRKSNKQGAENIFQGLTGYSISQKKIK